MKAKNILTINGREYDAITGAPINSETSTKSDKATKASSEHVGIADISFKKPPQVSRQKSPHAAVHKKPQRSQTLHRSALKRPILTKHVNGATEQITRSPSISKFAKAKAEPVSLSAKPMATKPQATAQPAKPHLAVSNNASATTKSSKEIKEMLIKERLAEAEAKDNESKQEKRGLFRRNPKLMTIMSSTLAVLLLGGYITYINLPNISMRVAASHAGIDADLPEYKPQGYNLEGPIAYTPGEVAVSYKSSSGPAKYTVKQKKTNWDSQAVLDNFVNKQASAYVTYQEQGLTIYSFNNEAAWVNGGILYTIEGDAQLSSDQVLRIATSL